MSEEDFESLLRETGKSWRLSALEAETQELVEHKKQVFQLVRASFEQPVDRTVISRLYLLPHSPGGRSMARQAAFLCVLMLTLVVSIRFAGKFTTSSSSVSIPEQATGIGEEDALESDVVDSEFSAAYALFESTLSADADTSEKVEEAVGQPNADYNETNELSNALYPDYTSLALETNESDFEEGDSDENETI